LVTVAPSLSRYDDYAIEHQEGEIMGFLDELTNINEAQLIGKTAPSTRLVDWFHQRASTNRPEDLHHSLGNSASQASQGDHGHDGKNGRALWAAEDVPNDLPVIATLPQTIDAVNLILARLREKSA
jgi:hypothetical protein